MDVAHIEPGADFAESIGNAVGACNAMLAVIGRQWPGPGPSPAQRRIDDPNDFVRLEIAAALKRGIPVIPVLVDGAGMPAKENLPPDLEGLTRGPAVELRERSWDEDLGRLIAVLEPDGGNAGRAPQRWWKKHRRAWALSVTLAVIFLAVGVRKFYLAGAKPDPAPAGEVRELSVSHASAIVQASATRALATLPDGCVAAASANGIVVWDPGAPSKSPVVQAPDSDAMAIAVVPGGRLAWGNRSGNIKVWDRGRKELQATLSGHTGAVVALAAMDDGRLASASWDGTVRLWNLATGKLEKTLARHTSQVRALAALGNGRLASGSTDGTTIVWNLAGETEKLKTLSRRGNAINALARLAADRVAVGSEDGAIEIWNCTTGDQETRLRAHRDWINALVVLGDGRIASASDDQTIGIWNPSKSVLDVRLEGHTGHVNALAVLPDGRLVSGSGDGTLRLWATRKMPNE